MSKEFSFPNKGTCDNQIQILIHHRQTAKIPLDIHPINL